MVILISNTQARAARGLLNLGQNDLAKKTRINPTQISAFERGAAGLSVANTKKIHDFFVSSGVDFLPFDGVRMKPTGSLKTLSGKEGLRELYDDIFQTAKNTGGKIDIFNGLPNDIIESLGKDWYAEHTERMKDIKNKYTFRVIIQKGDNNFIGAKFATYRWWAPDNFHKKMIYIYGSKVAFIAFEPNIEIIQINQQEIAESQRALFETAWGNAEEIS